MAIVYIIEGPDHLRYVGSTTLTLDHRWRCHLQAARGGAQQRIAQSLRVNGYVGFRVIQAYEGSLASCRAIEAFLVDLLDTYRFGLNMTPTGSTKGIKRVKTSRQIELHREALRGRSGKPHSAESKIKIAESARASWAAPEAREQRRKSMIGKKKGSRS